jgi:hypothetical protein
MGLEKYAETFKEIDKYGLLSEEDRNYLIERGILGRQEKKSDICCPNCGSNLPTEIIQKISEMVIEAIYKDREKYAKRVFTKTPNDSFDERDSIMFR